MKRPRTSLRILLLCHEDLIPPEDEAAASAEKLEQTETERDVLRALRALGHSVEVVGLYDELTPLREAVRKFRPHLAFNLLEEFHEQALYDYNIVAYLELLKVPYTGCNPRGMVLGRDKALSKKVLSYHRVKVPRFGVLRRGRKISRVAGLEFPLIVKSLTEDASLGISEASVVHNDEKFKERVEFIHRRVQTPAIAEQFIHGREIYVTVLGHSRLQVLPPWELCFAGLRDEAPKIATRRAKWDKAYKERRSLRLKAAADFSPERVERLARLSKRIYRSLNLSGYARIDFRVPEEGPPVFLEANPNPDIASDAESASAAASVGIGYEDFIQRLVRLGLRSLD